MIGVFQTALEFMNFVGRLLAILAIWLVFMFIFSNVIHYLYNFLRRKQ